jgi:Zn-dependent peptidase ImmA (M78 family)
LATNFRRGFKAEAERIAYELRTELKLTPSCRLDPHALAEHLCVPVKTLHDLIDYARDDARHLLGKGKSAFSAVTIHVSEFKRLVVTNPAHPATRQTNTVCHELSHIVLDHEAEAPLSMGAGRAWNGAQEREADWLAGCLLVPDEAAYAAALEDKTDDDVARMFGISKALATWRMRMTGARLRAQRRKQFSRS